MSKKSKPTPPADTTPDDDLGDLASLLGDEEGIAEEDLASILSNGGEIADDGVVEESADTPSTPADQAAKLKKLAVRFFIKHTFTPGQLIQWKAGLKNKRTPAYGEPLLVVEQMDKPIYAMDQSGGSPYFREPLTLIAAELDGEGDFVCFHYDSRRFEPYKG